MPSFILCSVAALVEEIVTGLGWFWFGMGALVEEGDGKGMTSSVKRNFLSTIVRRIRGKMKELPGLLDDCYLGN